MARSMLRQVLDYFEDSDKPLVLPKLAQELNISEAMLGEMIQYWIKKGKLREVNLNSCNCGSCNTQSNCPFIMTMPRMVERVYGDENAVPQCCCCSKGAVGEPNSSS